MTKHSLLLFAGFLFIACEDHPPPAPSVPWDHWSGRMHMEFIGDNQTIYYDFDSHGPGDTSLGEIFKIVIASGYKQSVV